LIIKGVQMMEARKDDRSGMSHDVADGSHSSGFTGLSVSATMGSSPQKVSFGVQLCSSYGFD